MNYLQINLFWCYSSPSWSLSLISILNKASISFVGSNWWQQIPCLCMKARMRRMFSRRVSFILLCSFVFNKWISENVRSTVALPNKQKFIKILVHDSIPVVYHINPKLLRLAVFCIFQWSCARDSPLLIKLCKISKSIISDHRVMFTRLIFATLLSRFR